MARTKPSKESEEKVVTPKRTPAPKQTVKAKQHPNVTPMKTATPIVKTATQPKRRTLQDRRPALKDLQKTVERKVVTKPIYGKSDSLTTKRISETKEVVIKPTGKPTAKPLPPGRSLGESPIAKARLQQEQAIDDARTAYTTKQREEGEAIRAFEQKKREVGETSYRLSLDNQGRYQRKR